MNRARIARVGQLLCVVGAVLGALGLLSWVAGAGHLTRIVRDGPNMVPNTAIMMALIGSAGALLRGERPRRLRRAVIVLAGMSAFAIGTLTLAEYALDLDLGVDHLIVDALDAPYGARPSPLTAFATSLLALAVLLFDVGLERRSRPAEWLVSAAGLTGFIALLGVLFGAGPLYLTAGTPVIGVALPTAVGVLLISAGLLMQRPNVGLMGVATSSGPGGMLLRRLTPVAILVPTLLGTLIARLVEVVGIEDYHLSFATLAVAMVVSSILMLAVTTVPLDRAHMALESSRARTYDLVEQASDGIFVADLQGRYTDVNRAGCQMLGYTREEILRMTIMDLIRAEDVERLLQSKAGMLAGGSHVAEWPLRRKDGTYLLAEVSAKILPDGRWQGLVRDVSERKLAEQQLRQSQERLELALRGADLASWDWNVVTGECIFNTRWAEMRGFRADEIAPQVHSWTSGVHPEDWPRVQAVLNDCLEGRIPDYETEHRVRTKSGEWIWILDRGRVFSRDENGRPTRMVGTELDITERKRGDAALRTLAEAGSVLPMSLDPEDTLNRIAQLAVRDFADLCIVDVVTGNGEPRRLKVMSRDAGMGWACDVLMQNPLGPTQQRLLLSLLERGRAVLIGVSEELATSLAQNEAHLRALRAIDPESVIFAPLLARGNLFGVITFVSSKTSRAFGSGDVRLAEELAQRAALSIDNAQLYFKAQQAIQARDDVLGVVAHDLRNPLSTVRMQAALLRRPGGEPERRSSKAAEIIDRAVTRMNRLIEDLLDVTQLESGHLSIELKHVPAKRIVMDAVDAQRAAFAQASIELALELPSELPDVWADRDRVLQIFENLIGNGLKFTEAGGRVVVGAVTRQDEVLFWVRDNGIGIAPENLPHVFDRFWQARKAERHGAGLGLPIVKGLVEAHHGRIWLESTPDRGSTFFFTIPTAARPEVSRPGAAPHVPRA